MSFFGIAIQAKGQQIVHIDNEVLFSVDKGFKANLSLQANFVQNINDIFQSNNLFQASYSYKDHKWVSLTNFNITKFNGSNIVHDGYQHFRYNKTLGKHITLEAFSQAQYNEIIKIDSRFLNGAGPRFTLHKSDSSNTRLFLGTLYMYEYETETSGIINRAHRMSSYLSLGFDWGKYIKVDVMAYFQPDILLLNDYRTSIEASFDIQINDHLSFRMQHSLYFDTRPPQEIRSLFYNFRNGLRYRFK